MGGSGSSIGVVPQGKRTENGEGKIAGGGCCRPDSSMAVQSTGDTADVKPTVAMGFLAKGTLGNDNYIAVRQQHQYQPRGGRGQAFLMEPSTVNQRPAASTPREVEPEAERTRTAGARRVLTGGEDWRAKVR